MTRIIAVVNQKGGVGKTTTTINLAASLVAMKRRVLVVDLDPQGNATTGAGVDKRARKRTVYHVLLGEAGIADVRVHSDSGGFDLVPSNRELAERYEADSRRRDLGLATLPSTIAMERATNPFLRVMEPQVLETLRSRRALNAATRVASFEALRFWKNVFRP